MDAIFNGGSAGNDVGTILSDLEDTLTLEASNNSSELQRIFGGDLIISVDILSKIAEYNRIHGNVSSAENFKKFAQAASHLLEKKNGQAWKEIYDVSAILFPFIKIAVPSLDTENIFILGLWSGSRVTPVYSVGPGYPPLLPPVSLFLYLGTWSKRC